MSAIAGIAHGAEDTAVHIRAMTAALAARGPDGEGVWSDGGTALGQRLLVPDGGEVDAAPAVSASGRHILILDGEVHNAFALRRDMELAGQAPGWRGTSDAETLVALIEAQGIDAALLRVAGPFALAVWDRRERRLSLARDRMGERPLYWGSAGGAVIFGSELKALRQHPGFQGGISREALMLYLRFAAVPAPWSIHPGVFKLEPGCILEVYADAPPPPQNVYPPRPGQTDGPLSIRRWWSLNESIGAGLGDQITDADAADAALEEILGAAVTRMMAGDAPVGAFLSGGIDSSLVTALMQERSTRPVQTFTIGFDDAAFNEAPFAAEVARHLGTDHHEMTVTSQDARDVIPLLPDLYDEPFADSSQVPTHLVARAARQQVRVALSGDAGDELFGGYNRYFWGPRIWSRASWMPRPIRRVLGAGIAAVPESRWDALGNLVGRIGGPRVSRAGNKAHKMAIPLRYANSVDDLYQSLVSQWHTPGAVVHGGTAQALTLLDDPLPRNLTDAGSRMMVQDQRLYLPDDCLVKVDRAAAGIGLATRAPFLDPEVVALAHRLSPSLKLEGGQGKVALRRLLYARVPRELIERPKAGFGIPVGDWIRGPLRPWAEELLAPARLAEGGFLDPAPICRTWDEHLSGRRDWITRLWPVLMLQAWRARWE